MDVILGLGLQGLLTGLSICGALMWESSSEVGVFTIAPTMSIVLSGRGTLTLSIAHRLLKHQQSNVTRQSKFSFVD